MGEGEKQRKGKRALVAAEGRLPSLCTLHESSHKPGFSSLPSQQSHMESSTRDDGRARLLEPIPPQKKEPFGHADVPIELQPSFRKSSSQ